MYLDLIQAHQRFVLHVDYDGRYSIGFLVLDSIFETNKNENDFFFQSNKTAKVFSTNRDYIAMTWIDFRWIFVDN